MSEMTGAGWEALPPYEEIPGFGLYMDQLVGFVDSCFSRSDVESLTPGMINSYVKNGMVTRPVNKKYSRESIAQLLKPAHTVSTSDLSPGDRVKHDKFGEGTVIELNGSVVTVIFDSVGTKKLAADKAPMKKI